MKSIRVVIDVTEEEPEWMGIGSKRVKEFDQYLILEGVPDDWDAEQIKNELEEIYHATSRVVGNG